MAAEEALSVLVVGAGELGKEILYSLAQHPRRNNSQITVMIRQSVSDSTSTNKRQLYQDLQSTHGINPLLGDIEEDSKDTLASKFQHFHTIIVAAGMTQSKGTQTKVTEAILAAAVAPGSKTRRYIPWQFGLDYDVIGPKAVNGMFAEQVRIREMLRSAQDVVSWVIVSTGIFTSFLFEPAFGVVEVGETSEGGEAVVRALGSWDNRVTYTAPGDIGRVTAEVVFSPEISNTVVYVAGDTASFADVKSAVERVFDKTVEGEEWSLDFLRRRLVEDPSNGMLMFRNVLAEGNGVSWDEQATFNAKRHIDTQTVEQYARQHLKR